MAEFRKGLYGIATAAAFAASALTTSVPAAAQQAKPQAAAAEQCVRKGDEIGTLTRCAGEKLLREEAKLKETQRAGRELEKQGVCLDALGAFKTKNPDAWRSLVADKGKDVIRNLVETDPCALAGSLPRKSASASKPLVLQQ